jgi:hypothetical protein
MKCLLKQYVLCHDQNSILRNMYRKINEHDVRNSQRISDKGTFERHLTQKGIRVAHVYRKEQIKL